VEALCAKRPDHFREQVEAVLRASATGGQAIVETVNQLLDSLDALLQAEGVQIPGK